MINISEVERKNVVVVGEPKTGKSTLINKLIEQLKTNDKETSFIVLTDNNLIKRESNVVVLHATQDSHSTAVKFLESVLMARAVSKFINGDIHKSNLTVIIDTPAFVHDRDTLRAIINKIIGLDNTNYIISAYSTNNAYKNVEVTIKMSLTLKESTGSHEITEYESEIIKETTKGGHKEK